MIDDVGRGESEKILESDERVICEMVFTVYGVTIYDKKADEIVVILDGDLIEYAWYNISELKNIVRTPPSKELFTRLGYI